MRAIRRCLLTTGALVITFVAVLVTEAMVARGGVHPGAGPPLPADAPAGPPGPPVDTVVWLGDSTGAGIGAGGLAGALPEQAAAEIGRPVRMTVLARSGDRVADVLHHQLPALAVIRPTVVFITVGANDTTHLTSRGDFRRDYERVLAGLPPGVRRVVILGVPDMGAPPRLAQPLRAVAGWRGRSLDRDVRHLAARTAGAVYVDIAGETGPAFRAHPATYFARDRFHPNDAGYALWARAVARTEASDRRRQGRDQLAGSQGASDSGRISNTIRRGPPGGAPQGAGHKGGGQLRGSGRAACASAGRTVPGQDSVYRREVPGLVISSEWY